jgi:rfaE bifunctional protein kinase chain/domain
MEMERSRIEAILNKFDDIKILVIGDSGVDKYTFGNAKRISREAPIPIVEVGQEKLKLGMAGNVSDNLAALKINNSLITVVGNDDRLPILKKLYTKGGIDTSGIIVDPNRRTTWKERVLAQNQQLCRIDYECTTPITSDIEEQILKQFKEKITSADAVIIEDYGKGGLSERVVQEMIKYTNEHNIPLYVDPEPNSNPYWYLGAHLFKPNDNEAQMIAARLNIKTDDFEELAEAIAKKLNLKKVIITLGPKGAVISDCTGQCKVKRLPTFAREVYDVSGAGDTTATILAAAVAAGALLEEAVYIASLGAGVVVGKTGTATVTREEIIDHHDLILNDKDGVL